ncbi:Beta-barrel assembly-enhancing protease [Candidatus Magnetaquicoccaceae bacterium FCR-1]|uniref:Beta-barrel assembly-enhancing protease n=1 Tax=Candidatus Magnetaquiglobus chichijimensis TaxID=3141448 RepID=A0ABQ0CA49_9PROT
MASEHAPELSRELASRLPLFADPGFEQAQEAASAGNLAAALAGYEAIDRANAARNFQDALLFGQRGDPGSLVMLAKKCVAADPNHYPAWRMLADLLSGREAEQACLKALEGYPDETGIRMRCVNLLTERQDLRGAVALLEATPAASRESPEVQRALADLSWKLGDFATAEPALRHCLRLNPADSQSCQTLIEILDRLDRLDEAVQVCRAFLGDNPTDGVIWVALADMLVRQGDWSEAEALFQALLGGQPSWLRVRQKYAEMLEKAGRHQEAIDTCWQNIQMAPNDLESYLCLTDMLHRFNNRPHAGIVLQRVCEQYAPSGDWGASVLPPSLSTRLIYHHLPEIASHYCTGRRALIDHTGITLTANPEEHGKVVELCCIVVGDEHIRFLNDVAFPSLLATEGFEDLRRSRRVVYNLYTTRVNLPGLEPFLAQLRRHSIPFRVNVELLSLSQDLYEVLCLPIIDQVRRSLESGSVVVMAVPDAIMTGSIARVIGDMRPHETVVCPMPRIDSARAYPVLKQALALGKGLRSRDFVRRCMTEFQHPQTYAALRGDSNCLRYRERDGYYEARNFAPPPLCFQARPEMLDHLIQAPMCGPTSHACFYIVDHDFVESAFRSNTMRLIQNSDYFFWAEFTGPLRHADFLAGRKGEHYYYPESSRFIHHQEVKWIHSD